MTNRRQGLCFSSLLWVGGYAFLHVFPDTLAWDALAILIGNVYLYAGAILLLKFNRADEGEDEDGDEYEERESYEFKRGEL